MALDAVTLIENLASGIFTAGLDLLFSWSEMIGFFWPHRTSDPATF